MIYPANPRLIFVTLRIFGREIPSFLILVMRVVLGNPRRAAAPSGPPIIQSVSSSVSKIKDRMQSMNVPDLELRVVGSELN